LLALTGLASNLTYAADGTACRTANGGTADTREIVAALAAFKPLLNEQQQKVLYQPFDYDHAIRWSNLPLGVVPRNGLRLGDLDAKQAAAARRVFEAALSACGLKLLDEIRLADDWLTAYDKRPIGWSGGNYFLTLLGTPGAKMPWMLQIGGHHLAYNFTFNGHSPGATPLFFGTEPIRFEIKGASYAPLDAQSGAMSRLAAAIAPLPQARLSGTFTDVVKGVVVNGAPGQLPTGGTDTGFPQSYPAGEQDRGVRVGQAEQEQADDRGRVPADQDPVGPGGPGEPAPGQPGGGHLHDGRDGHRDQRPPVPVGPGQHDADHAQHGEHGEAPQVEKHLPGQVPGVPRFGVRPPHHAGVIGR